MRLNLALQGGGSHGTFTWGVLERLLEEEDIDIVGISGTSAGAINAAIMIDGFTHGGREGAKAQLENFWRDISVAGGVFGPIEHPFGNLPNGPGLDWLNAFNPLDMLTRTFSPYDLNPLNLNPLRTVIERTLDARKIKGPIKLFVTATNVETGQARVFSGEEITVDVLLASGCLPFIFQAVEIEGSPYWDGGYMGNPSIWPLFYHTNCDDVLLVQLNPLQRVGTPKHALDIISRLNEITFNASLIGEMRAINFVKELVDSGKLSTREYKGIRMHMVTPPDEMHEMNASSKMDVDWNFFQLLRKTGRDAASNWLRKHKTAIGERATLDIRHHFLAKKLYAEKTSSTMVCSKNKNNRKSVKADRSF